MTTTNLYQTLQVKNIKGRGKIISYIISLNFSADMIRMSKACTSGNQLKIDISISFYGVRRKPVAKDGLLLQE